MKDRKARVRHKTRSISKRNRLSVFRSNNHLYAQLIDDTNGITLASASSFQKSIKYHQHINIFNEVFVSTKNQINLI